VSECLKHFQPDRLLGGPIAALCKCRLSNQTSSKAIFWQVRLIPLPIASADRAPTSFKTLIMGRSFRGQSRKPVMFKKDTCKVPAIKCKYDVCCLGTEKAPHIYLSWINKGSTEEDAASPAYFTIMPGKKDIQKAKQAARICRATTSLIRVAPHGLT